MGTRLFVLARHVLRGTSVEDPQERGKETLTMKHLGWAISLVVLGCDAKATTKADLTTVDSGAFVLDAGSVPGEPCENDYDCLDWDECLIYAGTTERRCQQRWEKPPPDTGRIAPDAGPSDAAPADAGPASATDSGPRG